MTLATINYIQAVLPTVEKLAIPYYKLQQRIHVTETSSNRTIHKINYDTILALNLLYFIFHKYYEAGRERVQCQAEGAIKTNDFKILKKIEKCVFHFENNGNNLLVPMIR